jgi:hypothetical protein
MANRQNAGFRVADARKATVMRFPVDSSNSTIVYRGDVMANNSAGSVRPAAADAGVTAVGICVGVYDANGVECGAPNSLHTTKSLPVSVAGYADVALALPDAIFIGQFGAGNTPVVADTFCSVDHVAGAGNTVMYTSGHYLNGGAKNTEAQFQVLGLVNSPDNVWGDYCDVYVRFLESALGQVNPTVGV